MKIGYNQATAMGCSTLEQDLALCERAGFDYIEIRLDMLRDYLQTHSMDELAAFFRKSRVKPHALNALYVYSEMFSQYDEEKKRDALLEEFLFGCQVGRAIGSEYFIIVPPLQRDPAGGPFLVPSQQTHRDCVRILNHLADRAAPYGMKLCFELVGFERSGVRSIEMADAIVREVGRPNVGFVFDSYNIYLNGGKNTFDELRYVPPEKIFAVHINNADDAPETERGQHLRRFCGEGVVDEAAFLAALKAAGYKGMVSIECFRPEYWQHAPEWVVAEAYRTTRDCLVQNGCL